MREDSVEHDMGKESDRFTAGAEAPGDMVCCTFCRALAQCAIVFSCGASTAPHEKFIRPGQVSGLPCKEKCLGLYVSVVIVAC